MKEQTLLVLCTLLSVILVSPASAQIVIKRCANGSTVGGNSYCPEEYNRPGYNAGGGGLVPRWGAIAIDISPNHKGYGYGGSWKSQEIANTLSMQLCKRKSPTCRVVSEFKNACSAVAYADSQGGDWIWAIGTHINADEAEKLALSNCYDKRKQGKYGKCGMAVYAMCAETSGKGATRLK